MRPPVYGIARSPLAGLRARDMRVAPLGVEIASLAPPGKIMCRCNGDWLLRESWASLTRDGDVIEFHEVAQDNGREALRGVVQLAVAYFTAGQSVWLQIGAQIAATAALNEFLPLAQPNLGNVETAGGPQQTGDTYSTSLGGNVARIDQAIWKVCGRKEITPPFACKPYLEYLPKPDAEDPELDRDQYMYVLYAVSVDDVDIVSAKIGNTPISRFADVLTERYLPPGVQPTTVLANVTTAGEVSSSVLDTGRYVGGYAVCAPQRTPSRIGIDVIATRGLGKGGGDPLTVNWRVETRPINDFGQVLGAWTILAEEERTAYTATPQRWSNDYEVPQRCEARVVRTDIQDTDPNALHEIAWTGLRAYLSEPAPLNEHTAHYEVVMRASSQLSAAASRDIRLIVEAKCRTLNEDLEWQPPTHNRNPAWWLLDLITSSTWGENKPDSRVDLQSFYDLAQTCDARQDRFDYVFDSSMSAWDAKQLIARAARARCFRRNGVVSVARDELAQVPVTAFTPRNCQPGMGISEKLRTRKSPDGVIVEYQDFRTNEWVQIDCPMPGVEAAEMVRPVRIRLPGITGPTHAQREGLYEAANMLYRPRTAQWVTEMQGELAAYMSPVDFLPDIQGYGNSGDVAFWDADTLTMTLTEPPDWSQAPLYLTLIRDDGSCAEEMEVEPGATAFEVVLPNEPDFELVLDDGTRERPKYLIGRKELVKVSAITDGGRTEMPDGSQGAQLYALRGVIEDERVHQADVHLLPGPGDAQDVPLNPNDAGGGGGGGGTDAIANLNNHVFRMTGSADLGTLANMAVILEFTNDGVLRYTMQSDPLSETFEVPYEWLLGGEVEPAVAGQFEVRFDLIATYDPASCSLTGTTGAWLGLGTSRSVTWGTADGSDLDTSLGARAVVRCQVREAGTDIVQADANITLAMRQEPSIPPP